MHSVLNKCTETLPELARLVMEGGRKRQSAAAGGWDEGPLFCRGSSFTVEVQPTGCSAGSNVSELGLSKILMSFQGGHSWDPLTAGLLFQMWRLQSCPPVHGAGVLLGLHGHNSMCTLPMVPIGQEVTAPVGFWWPKDSVRGKPKGCSCRNVGPISTAKLPYMDNFVLVNNIRPNLCLVTIWLLNSVQRLLSSSSILS